MLITSISLSAAYITFTYFLRPLVDRYIKSHLRKYLLPAGLYCYNLALYLYIAFPRAYKKTKRWMRNEKLYPLTQRLQNEIDH